MKLMKIKPFTAQKSGSKIDQFIVLICIQMFYFNLLICKILKHSYLAAIQNLFQNDSHQ